MPTVFNSRAEAPELQAETAEARKVLGVDRMLQAYRLAYWIDKAPLVPDELFDGMKKVALRILDPTSMIFSSPPATEKEYPLGTREDCETLRSWHA